MSFSVKAMAIEIFVCEKFIYSHTTNGNLNSEENQQTWQRKLNVLNLLKTL